MNESKIEIGFSIENDVLIVNETEVTDNPHVFTVHKQPIISKEAFQECYRRWIKEEE